MSDWKGLLAAVKADCLVGLWSRGTELARDKAVAGQHHGQNHGNDGWAFRVRTSLSERSVAATVRLFPDDLEWDCDCDGSFDPCEHVAACTIAMAATPDAAERFFADAGRAGGIHYIFTSGEGGLTLERLRPELGFTQTHADVAVERLLSHAPAGPLSFDTAVALLRLLASATEISLDGVPVRASGEPIYPSARVVDAPGGCIELVVAADPEVSRVVAPGVLLRRDTLHPFGAHTKFGKRWERLPFRRAFQASEIAELVGTVIPELERHVPVHVQTTRLPERAGPLDPWIRFEIDFVEQGLDVLPLLVYGDPPQARVEDDRVIHLKGGVPERQPAAETNLVLRLRHELNLVPGRRVHFVPADAARLLSTLETFDDGRTAFARSRSVTTQRRVGLVPRIVRRDGEISIVFEPVGAAAKGDAVPCADANTVVSAWRDGIGLVPLGDGTFGSVPTGWLEQHGHLVADLLAARGENDGRTPVAALPLVGELCEAMETPPPVDVERFRALLDAESAPATTPTGFRGELRAYQVAGVAWLARLREAGLGAVLADDMGLGKTIQALCVVRGRTLVVCPRSVIHNWTKEAERFRPDLKVALYHGPSRTLTDADVTLTTYATLRNDAEILSEVNWDCVVLDEAQAIKNPDSKVARAAYGLRAEFKVSLSGTPIENRLDELWSQMHFVNRGLLGGRRSFGDRYEKPMLAGDATVTERLRRRIRPFLLRRLKREVATVLPPLTDAILYCELDTDERALYEAVRLAARAEIVRELSDGTNVMAAFEALLRLRQAACHSGLLPDRETDTSSKVEALCEALEDAVADGHKALVFSQWTSLLDRVEPQLDARSIAFTRLDGTTRDRGAVVDAFQDPAGPPVFLLSLKAGGTGLNLTAADHVFLLDPWWNPAVEEQAADRAHRIGQDRPVMVYRMVAKDTVEERVLDLQRRKREIADAALAGGAQTLGATITREDILALLD